jgi:DNA-binding NarL/FixJ family response regulator
MMSQQKTNIWIVEDDQFLRESFASIINSSEEFFASNTYRTAEEVLKALAKDSKPDIVLMDIELPGINGVKCTEQVKSKYNSIIVIMVTVYDDSDLVFDSLRAGASGYITKSSNYTQLLGAIREIANGGAPMSSKIAKMVIDSFHRNPNSPLSKREAQILQFVASGKTFTQISKALFIARETTKTHVRNIYRKLEVNCRADAIAKATKDHLI